MLAALEAQGLELAVILVTHHHADHIGGVAALADRFHVPVYGPAREDIPGRTTALAEGDEVALPALGLRFRVYDVPGHTAGHIAYYGHGALFCGDTLFSGGCGRLFEGTPAQMLSSLDKLAALPPETRVYCAHEYTAANLKFAAAVEPGQCRAREYRGLVTRASGTQRADHPDDARARVAHQPVPADAPAERARGRRGPRRPGPRRRRRRLRGRPRMEERFPLMPAPPGRTQACAGTLAGAARRGTAGGCATPAPRDPGSDWPMVPSTRVARAAPPAEVAEPAPPHENASAEPTTESLVSSPVPPESSPLAELPNIFDRIRLGYKLPEVADRSIDGQVRFFAGKPDFLDRTFERAEHYLYYVVRELEARDMPLELAFLPVIESAYNPYAYSRARAAGIWQFIAPTARRYDVRVNWWQDGRRDIVDSTRAALDYLSELHTMFDGDWFLAIAAYNCGEAAVQRAVTKARRAGKPADFWHLKLPKETHGYVPALLAMARIVADPDKYGLEFATIAEQALLRTGRGRQPDRPPARGDAAQRLGGGAPRAQPGVQPLGDRPRRSAPPARAQRRRARVRAHGRRRCHRSCGCRSSTIASSTATRSRGSRATATSRCRRSGR